MFVSTYALCGGTGFETVSREGREFAQACACRQASAHAALGAWPAAGSRGATSSCTLGSFEPGNSSLSAALEKAMAFCAGYPYLGTDEGLGLLFSGDNGVGKTHLAVAVLRELAVAKGAHGQFWDFHELIREIKSSYDPETKTTELMVLEPVVEATCCFSTTSGRGR